MFVLLGWSLMLQRVCEHYGECECMCVGVRGVGKLDVNAIFTVLADCVCARVCLGLRQQPITSKTEAVRS